MKSFNINKPCAEKSNKYTRCKHILATACRKTDEMCLQVQNHGIQVVTERLKQILKTSIKILKTK